MIKFRRDEHNTLSKVVKEVIHDNEEFSLLKDLRFLYTYHVGDLEYDDTGFPREGAVKKCSNRERDIYRKDVQLWTHADTWEVKPERLKHQLIYGLLLSVHVETDEHLEPVRDDDERIKFAIIKPDLVIAVFSKELEKYGLPTRFRPVLQTLEAQRMRERNGVEHE